MYRYKEEIFTTQSGTNYGSYLRVVEVCGEASGREARLFGYCLCVVEERPSGGEG